MEKHSTADIAEYTAALQKAVDSITQLRNRVAAGENPEFFLQMQMDHPEDKDAWVGHSLRHMGFEGAVNFITTLFDSFDYNPAIVAVVVEESLRRHALQGSMPKATVPASGTLQ